MPHFLSPVLEDETLFYWGLILLFGPDSNWLPVSVLRTLGAFSSLTTVVLRVLPVGRCDLPMLIGFLQNSKVIRVLGAPTMVDLVKTGWW